MRIDLYNNRRRPVPARLGLALMKHTIGFASPPLVFFSYAPFLLGLDGVRYLARANSHPGPWTHGEDELMGSFVSSLNECHF